MACEYRFHCVTRIRHKPHYMQEDVCLSDMLKLKCVVYQEYRRLEFMGVEFDKIEAPEESE